MEISDSTRSWVPFVILIVLVIGGISYFIFWGGESNVRQSVPPKPGCVPIMDNGDYGKSVDIVFLPDNFDDVGKFREVTESMVDSFLQTVPYNQYTDKFNFFRIENLDLVLNCDYEYGGDAIVCDPSSAKSAAISCPHDYVMVAVDVDGIQRLFELLRSSAWRGVASLNVDDDPLVFTHEFAHLFADFADEYEYGGEITWDAPNCDSSLQTCPKFQVVDRYDCVKGCVNNNNARSIETGIMRDYWKSNVYGDYNEYVISDVIERSTTNLEQTLLQGSMPINLIQIRFSNGNWEILSVEEEIGFPDGENIGIKGEDEISVIDSDGKVISKLNLAVPRLYLDGHDDAGNVRQDVLDIETTLSISLPRSDEDDKILIEKGGEAISALNLKESNWGGLGSFNTRSVNIPQTYSV